MRAKTSCMIKVVVPMLLSFHAAEALAQQPPPPAPPAAEPTAGDDRDGVRFRGGVSLAAGTMFLSSYSGFLAGVDGRLGVQINDMIGVYAVPHLTLGPISVGSLSTFIGVFSTTAVVDVTLIDQIYVGAGGGFGVVNNPTGPALHFRAGGYPLMGYGENGIRRKGLMVGADMRMYLLSGITVMELTGGVGYEAF